MPYLVVRLQGQDTRRLPLEQPLTIGRSRQCDVWFNDTILSRQHCRIEKNALGEWMLIDLRSHNGTRINGRSVDLYTLRDGDEFHVGNLRVTFHAREFTGARAANPEDAIINSLMAPEQNHATHTPGEPAVEHLQARKVTVYNRPLVPSPVDLWPNAGEPVVKPFALPFTRPQPSPQIPQQPPPSTESKPRPKSLLGSLASIFNSRGPT